MPTRRVIPPQGTGPSGAVSGKQPSPEAHVDQTMRQAGQRAQKRARHTLGGEEGDSDFQVANEVKSRGQNGTPENDGFIEVLGKSDKKKRVKEEAALEKLRRELSDSKKGVFKVALRPKSLPDAQNSSAGFPPGRLLSLFKELHQIFPSCSLSGDTGSIYLWAPTLELAKEIMAVSSVGSLPVAATCNSLSSFKARIEHVSMAFAIDEIVAELAPLGVVSAQKFPYRRLDGRASGAGKVLLAFDRPPPPSVFLGYKSHAVIMEVAKPLMCFNCQRLGHHSSQCSLPRACRRCGGHDHLAAACLKSPRCVNCKGHHPAGSNDCPRSAFYAEKNRLLMEARVLQQVRASEPSAYIASEAQGKPVESHTVASAEAPSAPAKTFASVVRSIAVTENGVSAPAVLLPRTRSIPRERRAARFSRLPTRPARRPKAHRQRKVSTRRKARAGQLDNLGALADLLQAFSPEAAAAVRTLMTHLQPLLSLVRLVQRGNLFKKTKNDPPKQS